MKKKRYLGLTKIGNKVYKCEVVDGVRYINGMTTDDFLNTLSKTDFLEVAKKGYEIIKKNNLNA